MLDRERQELEAIERELAASDPRLAARLSGVSRWRMTPSVRAVLGVVVLVAGTVLTLALLVVSPWLGWIGVAVAAAGSVVLVDPVRRLAARRRH